MRETGLCCICPAEEESRLGERQDARYFQFLACFFKNVTFLERMNLFSNIFARNVLTAENKRYYIRPAF